MLIRLRGEERLRSTADVVDEQVRHVQRPRPAIAPASRVSGLMTFSTAEIHSRADNDKTGPQDTVQQNALSNKEKCHRGNVSA